MRSYLNLLFDSLREGSYKSAVEHESTSTRTPVDGDHSLTSWRKEVQEAERAYDDLLRNVIAKQFPRAGEINKPLLDFVDRVAEGWVLGGRRTEDTPEAIEVRATGTKDIILIGADQSLKLLYRSAALTFQSQRTIRHLIRFLVSRGSYEEANHALDLYVQLFTEAKETKVSQVAKEAEELRRKSIESEGGEKPRLRDGEADVDSDRDFADTLAFGSRFLCRYLHKIPRAVELADLANKTLGELRKDASEEDRQLWARVSRFQGISRAQLAWEGAWHMPFL
jgi:hypothetical protein